jgi:hypothetical protein
MEILLVSLIEGLGRAPLGSRAFIASVLEDAANTTRSASSEPASSADAG